jgi:hypothetical protein
VRWIVAFNGIASLAAWHRHCTHRRHQLPQPMRLELLHARACAAAAADAAEAASLLAMLMISTPAYAPPVPRFQEQN